MKENNSLSLLNQKSSDNPLKTCHHGSHSLEILFVIAQTVGSNFSWCCRLDGGVRAQPPPGLVGGVHCSATVLGISFLTWTRK